MDMALDKKVYARGQYEFLKSKGIKDRLRLSRIFKVAGPGQIQEAWKLATCEEWESDNGKLRKDMLDCLLAGFGSVKYGRERFEQVLKHLGFYIPESKNDVCFYRIIDGASEILVPGSYEFTPEEMREIEAGLKKRIYDNKVDEDEAREENVRE